MSVYSDREVDLPNRISRLEKDVMAYKSAQLLGGDVVRPKISERLNSDGSPSTWDIQGNMNDYGGGFILYRFIATVEVTSKTQQQPYGIIYYKFRSNPSDTIISFAAQGLTAYMDTSLLAPRKLTFNLYGAASSMYGPPYDSTIDRLWVKLYFYGTDYVDFNISISEGTVVPLT